MTAIAKRTLLTFVILAGLAAIGGCQSVPSSSTPGAAPAVGEAYVGPYRDGKYDGQGTLNFANGEKYVGQFHDGLRDGRGTYTWPDGRRYAGEFRAGLPDGHGTYTFPNGERYEGEYRGNVRSGQGAYRWPDGRLYVGQFSNDRPSGQGTYTWPDGKKYVGEFRDGQANGLGTYTWPDGRRYVGELRDDQPDGRGTLSYPDGRRQAGLFRNGEYVSDTSSPTPVAYSPGPGPANGAGEIQMQRRGGTFTVPVVVNDAVTLDFHLDSGAADVAVPQQVFDALKRSGTISPTDQLGQETYTLADGSTSHAAIFRLRSLKVGNIVLENVRASVSRYAGPPLLGMSFLGRFKSWSVDNDRHVLILK